MGRLTDPTVVYLLWRRNATDTVEGPWMHEEHEKLQQVVLHGSAMSMCVREEGREDDRLARASGALRARQVGVECLPPLL